MFGFRDKVPNKVRDKIAKKALKNMAKGFEKSHPDLKDKIDSMIRHEAEGQGKVWDEEKQDWVKKEE